MNRLTVRQCPMCGAEGNVYDSRVQRDGTIKRWRSCPQCYERWKTIESRPKQKVDIPIYDQEQIIENCTVQILTNSITGDVSVGWWENKMEEDECM